jgi:excinuclease ABC subunit A
MEKFIKIRGARQHNLKNVNIDIPKNKLVVFTGVSGSGKSSLAFDTIYAEGQRRYVESLSTYARQFLGIMERPDVDFIEGLSPSISIDQKTTSNNPRSTVGTTTEVYDYLRLLFARVGHPHCPICGREISNQSADEIKEAILEIIKGYLSVNPAIRLLILSPVVKDKKGEFSMLLANLKAKGFSSVRIDGKIYLLSDDLNLIRTNRHNIEVVIDKLSFSLKDFRDKIFHANLESRILTDIEQSLEISDGLCIASIVSDSSLEMPTNPKEFDDHLFSQRFACPIDNISLDEIEPRTFSFNSPHGACKKCSGLGHLLKVDTSTLFSWELSIMEGAILPLSNALQTDSWFTRLFFTFCEENSINTKIALKKLDKEKIKMLLEGTGDRIYEVVGTNRFGKLTKIYETFNGIVSLLEERYQNTSSDAVKEHTRRFFSEFVCDECGGSRLRKEALGITIDKKSINDIVSMPIKDALKWISDLQNGPILNQREQEIARPILKEIYTRIRFLYEVGLGYLTLSRSSSSLSGGEAQRIRLASQIGSGLTGVLYVLDEPTVGLHQSDNEKLIMTLFHLRDLGNTVIVVEHDEEMIRSSDFVVDFGPGAGKYGGEIVASGSPRDIEEHKKSITGQYLSGRKKVFVGGKQERTDNAGSLIIEGCSKFNLKNITVTFPLSKLVVITGVSGSGKSTLLVETLFPALRSHLSRFPQASKLGYRRLIGGDNIEKVILIDQSPIGRTPRSNPATYTKIFDLIRDIFAQTRDARILGFKKGRFSFNVRGGRCEACEGQGETKIEMQFMSDIWIKCEVCNGKRYNSQTLEVVYKGKNISEVLEMTVDEAVDFFHNHHLLQSKLQVLKDVGLGYIQLGQPATTLSGGEAQRIKLSAELMKKEGGRNAYILDEPTTGLHLDDIQKLLQVLKELVRRGNSVFVIEHNLDVIKNADWIIDLGPGGGDEGGRIVVEGTVTDLLSNEASLTGRYLRRHMQKK